MRNIFRSLKTRNYRLYFSGQVVSLIGTWMQIIANSWLVLELTHSGLAVGIAAALQFGPTLVGGAWGGLLADRFPKHRTLLFTQSLFAVQALTLGVLTAGGWAKLWMVYSLTLAYGIVQVIDVPARQAFVSEMVSADDVMNAVGLNSAIFNLARMVGPAIAGILIAKASISICYFANAGSFLFVLTALALMRKRDLHHQGVSLQRGPGQIREGLRYVVSHPDLLLSIVLMAVIGTLGLNFQIIMPLLAKFTFHGNASTYGFLSVAMAGGSVVGAMYAAGRHRASPRLLVGAAIAFGAAETVAAAVPSLLVAYVVFPFVGLSAMLFITASNSLLQVNAAPEMRGRVLAIWSLVFLGSTPIGGPLVGWISQTTSPRFGFAVGGVASLIAGLIVGPLLLRRSEPTPSEPVELPEVAVEAAR